MIAAIGQATEATKAEHASSGGVAHADQLRPSAPSANSAERGEADEAAAVAAFADYDGRLSVVVRVRDEADTAGGGGDPIAGRLTLLAHAVCRLDPVFIAGQGRVFFGPP